MKRTIILLIIIVCFQNFFYAQDILLKANHYFDSEKAVFKENVEILIRRNRILEVGKT